MSKSGDVYTLNDLKRWQESGLPRTHPKFAVIGDPIAHSRSPEMHQPMLDSSGIDASYIRLYLTGAELKEGFELLQALEFTGVNVTIPHKEDVFHLMSERTPIANRIGVVNTVLIDGDRLIGHNTDAPGLQAALRETFAVDLHDLRILILGAGGGAGRAAAIQCSSEQCERLVLVNRTLEKAQSVAEEVKPLMDRTDLEGAGARLTAMKPTDPRLETELDQVDLIINATSLGMKASDSEAFPYRFLQPHHLVYDMVYAPPATRLMKSAINQGGRAENGLSMLLWQGALAFEFWTGLQADVEIMRRGLAE